MASGGRGSKQGQGERVDAEMAEEIQKLLNEPTRLSEQSSGAKRSNGNGDLRVVGGRVRRFTESVAVNSGKYTVIHENGEWKAGDTQAEGGISKVEKVAKVEGDAGKGAKPGTLVKMERQPFGKNSRQSRTGMRGMAKKGGAGGKCVWGKPGSELQAEFDPEALDAGDPNYDSNDECAPEREAGKRTDVKAKAAKVRRLTDEQLMSRIDSVLREYFQHANVEDCIDSLGEIPFGRFAPSVTLSHDGAPDSHVSSATVSPTVIGDAPLRLDGSNAQVSPSDSGYAVSLTDANKGSRSAASADFAETFGEAPDSRRYLIVREALLLSYERHSSDRELVSQLLAELASQRRLDNVDFACGFDSVLRDLTDLRTDCPDAPKWTGMFLARAFDDEVLASDWFLGAYRGRSRSPFMTVALDTCATLLELRKPRSPSTSGTPSGNGNGHVHHESGSKSSLNSAGSGVGGLWNVWGVGATRPVNSLVREMRMLIDEYVSSDDFNEALRCVTELDVPHFHHELVYQAVLVVLESAHSPIQGAQVAIRVCTLLRRFAEAGALPIQELEIGFRRVYTALPDLELDVPRATSAFEQFAALCQHQSFLPRSVLKELAGSKSGRKRYMSETDASVARSTSGSLKYAADH